METVDDYLNWKKETAQKPPTAVGGGGSMPIFLPNGEILEGPSNRPLGEAPSGAVSASGDVIDSSIQRVGDYVYSQGRAYLVPNSVTDLKLKGAVVSGGSKTPASVSNTSWQDAIKGASVGTMAGRFAGGPTGAIVGGIAGGILGNIYGSMTARANAEKEWKEQKIDYDTAVDFYTDEDGRLKYHFDYAKMAKGGELSSPYVIQMQKEETEVGLSDDGRLKIKVSPIFAATEYYKSIVDDISSAYAGLTKDVADFDQKIADIKKYIESAKNNYMANAISYAAYRASFPGASDTAIIAGYTTAFAGNADPEDMDKYTVYSVSDGEIVEQSAREFFDEFLEMGMDKRNDFVKELIQTISGGDEDEKVVAYGELQALYAASANKYGYKNDKYQGMMNAEGMVTFWNQFQILDNIFLGDGRQEYLVQNEYVQNIGTLASVGARTYLTLKGLHTIQSVLPHVPGFRALYNASFLGEAGQAAGFFAAASQNLPQLIKAGSATLLFNTSVSAIFNAAVSGARIATGDKPEEVWGEFGKNLLIDTAILTAMQFYDVVKFKATVTDTTQFVYKDPKTGEIKILNTDINTDGAPVSSMAEVDIDGNPIGEYVKVGEINISKTSRGTDVGYAKSGETTLYRYGDKIYVVNNSGNASTWANATGESTPPKALSTGIIQEGGVAVSDAGLAAAVKSAKLPTGTKIFALPSKDAYAAIAAGKFTKIDSSKVGLKINEAIFNTNAALDYVNEKALAKTGDRTAWQVGNEAFSSIQAKADSFRKDIDVGKWYKPVVESKRARIMAYGDFTAEFGRMTKSDQLYMKAKESIARAKIAQETLPQDSGVDLVAEAIAKNGKYLDDVSPERAAALDKYVSATKQYIKDYIISVKKSGHVDAQAINNVINSDISRKIGYIPMWGKKESYNTLLNQYFLVDQERKPIKAWNREGDILDVKDIMDFITSTNRLMDFFATNMATNFRNLVAAEQLESAGMLVDNKISTEQKRKELLSKVANFDELKDKLAEMSDKAKRSVNRSVPSPEKYREQMAKIYTDSGVEKDIEAFSEGPKVKQDKAANLGAAEEKPVFRAPANIVRKAEDIVRKAAKYNDKFGRDVDVDAYIETSLKPMLNRGLSTGNRDLIRATIANAELEIAPYVDRASVLKTRLDGVAKEWRKWADENTKFVAGTDKDDMSYAIDVAAAEINGTTTDSYVMGAAQKAAGMGRTYPVSYFENGRPYTRYIKAETETEKMIAEHISHILNDEQLIMKRGVFNQAARSLANGFRLLTTGADPSRVFPNATRDTVRGEAASGGVSFTSKGASRILKELLQAYDYTDEQKQMLASAFDNIADKVAGDTYNAAYGTRSRADKELQREYYRLKKDDSSNKLVKFSYDLKTLAYNMTHSPQKIFEAPGDFFEGYTRKRLAKSAFVNALREAQLQGKDFENQYEAAEAAADFAGHEYTANFYRKGKVVGEISQYVAYFNTNFANFDSFKRAYINNPQGVSRSFATFMLAYMAVLADTLSNEKSRKNYYRLTDYDRSNSIAVSMDDGTILTIPMDETLSGLMFPFRRILETMSNVDPVSFYEFIWGTLTEPLPIDFSGFSEGDYFNFKRGIEKFVSGAAPTWATGALEAITGYDLYYGSSNAITQEDLREQGIYDPQPGDYTSKSKNSATLREISNATGIPQWQLQTLLRNYGGNVGQYVIGTIDKLSKASEDAQGGKDFFDAIFKSFVATDYDAASSEFYNVVNSLKVDKNKLLQKLSDIRERSETASGDALYKLQDEYRKAVDDYAIKVGDAVNQYLDAYEITGGLSKSQAMQVYYLFRLDDDDSLVMPGSVEEYQRDLAEREAAEEATRSGASVLDRYYDQSARPYLDSTGTWRIAPTYGENAFYNTIYGQGVQYEVDLRNLLDKGDSSLKQLRSDAKEAGYQATKARDFDLYDKIAYEYDKRVIERIAPYIQKNGASNVLTNSTALKYLEDWIMVPNEWMTNKKGKYVSLGHNAKKEKAFVAPYIKYLFGLDTGLSADYDEEKAKLTLRGQ